jgi:hypothetical protein
VFLYALRDHVTPSTSLVKTERWIFGIPISTHCIYSIIVVLYIISMKPLELMKQGGQLPRSKPPVEQRVKVMDTLDKKMQTILEREDLSIGFQFFQQELCLGLHCFWYVVQNFVVDQVLFHGFRCDCHGSGSVIVVDI